MRALLSFIAAHHHRTLTMACKAIKESDPLAFVGRFDSVVVAVEGAHVGQDSCTRTLLVAFQSL